MTGIQQLTRQSSGIFAFVCGSWYSVLIELLFVSWYHTVASYSWLQKTYLSYSKGGTTTLGQMVSCYGWLAGCQQFNRLLSH